MTDITDAGPRLKAMNERLEELRTAADQADVEYREEITRLRLTDEEREAVDTAEASLMRESTDLNTPLTVRQRLGAAAATLRGLLARLRDTPAALSKPSEGIEQNGCTLTDEEREAVRFCVTAALPETAKLGGVAGELCRMHAATLRALLERLGGGR